MGLMINFFSGSESANMKKVQEMPNIRHLLQKSCLKLDLVCISASSSLNTHPTDGACQQNLSIFKEGVCPIWNEEKILLFS